MRGIWYVVPTPFDEQGELLTEDLEVLIRASLEWGVDGLTVLGVMSEVATLTEAERSRVLDTIFRAAAGRLPIVVGCSATSAEIVIHRIRDALAHGAIGAMVSAPPLFSDVDRLPTFFERVAAAGLPLVIQDEPRATGVRIPTSLLLSSIQQSGARVVKLEDPPTAPKIAALVAADPELEVFGGLGGVAALSELDHGAAGLMTGFAVPEILRAIYDAWVVDDKALAATLFDRYLPLVMFEGQVGIGLGIRKEVLRRRGLISSSHVRMSSATITDSIRRELGDIMVGSGLGFGQGRMKVPNPSGE